MAVEMAPGGLGRLYSPDERDHQFLMRTAQPPEHEAALVGMATYRRGPILDQGQTGTCVAHAWRAWLNGEPIRTTQGPNPFALYDMCILNDEFPDNDKDSTDRQMGTSVRAGAKVLTNIGHVKSYLWAFTVDDVRRWVLSGQGGIVFGINWYEGLGRPDAEGIIRATGSNQGGHAIYCFGADDRNGYVYLQNSWGKDWGGWPHPKIRAQMIYRGCARLPYDDLERLLREQGEACTATEARLPVVRDVVP